LNTSRHSPGVQLAISATVLALVLAYLYLFDPVIENEVPDATIWKYHWSFCTFVTTFGLCVIYCGIQLLRGQWKFEHSRQTFGVVFLIIGVVAFFAALLTFPFARVMLTSRHLVIEQGLLGRSGHTKIDLSNVTRIEIYDVERGRSRRRRFHTMASFITNDGAKQIVQVDERLIEPAFEQVLQRAHQQGVDITDRRATTP
jgi:hypothetical protein